MAGNQHNKNEFLAKLQSSNRHSFAASGCSQNESHDSSATATVTNGTKVIRKLILLDPDKLRQFGVDMKIKNAASQSIESPINKFYSPVNRTIKLVQKVKLTPALSSKRAEKIPETSINLNLLQQQISHKLNLNRSLPSSSNNSNINSTQPIKTSPTTNNPNGGMFSPHNIKKVKIIPKGDNPELGHVVLDADNNFKGWSDDKNDPVGLVRNNNTNSGSPISQITAKRLSDVIKSKSCSSSKQNHNTKMVVPNRTAITSFKPEIQEQISHRLVPKQIEISKMVKSPRNVKNLFTIPGTIVDRTRPPAITYDIKSIPTTSRESIGAPSPRHTGVSTEAKPLEQFIQSTEFRPPENRDRSAEFTKIPAKFLGSKPGGKKPQKLWSKFNKFKKRNKKLQMENNELKSRLYSLMENISSMNSSNSEIHLPFDETASSNNLLPAKVRPILVETPNPVLQVNQALTSIVERNDYPALPEDILPTSEDISACDMDVKPIEELLGDKASSLVLSPIQEIKTGRLRGKKKIPCLVADNKVRSANCLQRPAKECNESVELDVNKNNLDGCKSVIIKRIESPCLVVPVIKIDHDTEMLVPEMAEELEISDVDQSYLEHNDELELFSNLKHLDDDLNIVEEAQDDTNLKINVSVDSFRDHNYSLREYNVGEEIKPIMTESQETDPINSAFNSFIIEEPNNMKTPAKKSNPLIVILENRLMVVKNKRSIPNYQELPTCTNIEMPQFIINRYESTVSTKTEEPTISHVIKESNSKHNKSSGNRNLLKQATQDIPLIMEQKEANCMQPPNSPNAPVEISSYSMNTISESNEVETKTIPVVYDKNYLAMATHDEIQIPQEPSIQIKQPGEVLNKEVLVSKANESPEIPNKLKSTRRSKTVLEKYNLEAESIMPSPIETSIFNEPRKSNRPGNLRKSLLEDDPKPVKPVRIYLSNKISKVSNLDSTEAFVKTEIINPPMTKIQQYSSRTPETSLTGHKRQRKPKRLPSTEITETLTPLLTRDREILETEIQKTPLIVDTEDFEEMYIEPPAYSPIVAVDISVKPLKEIPEYKELETKASPVINFEPGVEINFPGKKEVVRETSESIETQNKLKLEKKSGKVLEKVVSKQILQSSKEQPMETSHGNTSESQKSKKQSKSRKAFHEAEPNTLIPTHPNNRNSKAPNLDSDEILTKTEVITMPTVKLKPELSQATSNTPVTRAKRSIRLPSTEITETLAPLPTKNRTILKKEPEEIPLIVDTEGSEEICIQPPAYSPITPVEISVNSLKENSEFKEVETRTIPDIKIVKNTSVNEIQALQQLGIEIELFGEAMNQVVLSATSEPLETQNKLKSARKSKKVLKKEVPTQILPSSIGRSMETSFPNASEPQKSNKESNSSIDHESESLKHIRTYLSNKKTKASNIDSIEISVKTEVIKMPIAKTKPESSLPTPDISVTRPKRQRKPKSLSPEITETQRNRRRSRKSTSPSTDWDTTSTTTPTGTIKTLAGKRLPKPRVKSISRKRIKLEQESLVVQSDEEDFFGFPDNTVMPVPMQELINEIKTEPQFDQNIDQTVKKTKTPHLHNNVTCGNCKESLLAKNWNKHLRKHNGLGFREGLDQPIDLTDIRGITNTMIYYMRMHKLTFVTCEKCGTTRKSALGLMNHVQICGLSEEEQRVACIHCGNRLLPMSIQYHMQNSCAVLKQNEINELMKEKESAAVPEEEEVGLDVTQSGRAKRKSVKAAEKKIKNFIELIDDVNLDDHFTEKKPFKFSGGMKRGWIGQLKNTGIIKCKNKSCDYTTDSVEQITLHASTCRNADEVYGFYCRHCKFYSLIREPMVEHITKDHGNLLTNINNLEYHSGSEATAGEESSESDGSSGEDEIECDGGSDYAENDDLLDEDGHERTRLRSSAVGTSGGGSEYKTSETAETLLRDYSLLIKQPQMTSSFYHFAFKWMVDFVEKHFTCDPLYTNLRPSITRYISETDAKAYIPIPKTSPKFSFRVENVYESDYGKTAKKVSPDEWHHLNVFDSKYNQKHNIILFCGGPILCLDWASFPVSYKGDQYLAVSCYQDYNDSTKSNELQTKKGLIQVWNLGVFTKKQVPTMKYAFKVDFGPVCDIKFCPSGGYIPAERIGLLAVTSLVGDVYIYSLPYNIDEQQASNIIELEPSITLRPCINVTTKCRQAYRLTWTKDKEHSIVATGYTDGWVAVWNLKTESKLLKKIIDGRLVIIPTKIFHPFSSTIHGIEIFYVNNSQWLMVAADKNVKLFDLKTYPYPHEVSNVYQKSTVTCSAWSIHWPGYLLGLNESFCLLRNSVTLTQPHEIGYKNYPMQSFDATVTDITVSDYLNAYAAATDSGDIISYLPRDLLLNISRKGNRRIKLILGYTDAIDLDTEQTSDIPSKFGVVFCDLAEPVLSSLNDLKSKRHRRWTLEQYPIVTITRIKFNPNQHFHKYYALGMQAGFVRIRYMMPRSGCYN